MADAPAPVASSPDQPGQPYDAADTGAIGPWAKLDSSGPADMTGNTSGDWPDGPGPWKQT